MNFSPRLLIFSSIQTLLLPFCLACLSSLLHGEQIMDSADVLSVAQNSAFERVKNGYFPDALSAEQEALKTMENRLGPTHPSLAPVLINLATIERYMGRFPEAETSLKWALALREKAFGPDNILVGGSCLQLAALYDGWGKWAEAEFWAKKAFHLFQTQEGSTLENQCQTMNLLGGIELNLGKIQDADALFKESLQLQEKFPTNAVLKIQTLTDLAKVQTAAKHFSEAESNLQEALNQSRQSFSPGSVEVADAMERLGDYYHSRNQPNKAVPLYQSALKIDKGFIGTYFGYSNLAYIQRLAKAYQSVNDDKSALDLWEKDLKITQESFGPNHPQTALILINLAKVEKKLGEDQKAQEHIKEALAILESSFPKDYPLTLEAKRLK